VAGHVAAGGDAQRVLTPLILSASKAACSIEATARQDDFSVETFAEIVSRIEFDYAAHLASVFRREVRGVDAH